MYPSSVPEVVTTAHELSLPAVTVTTPAAEAAVVYGCVKVCRPDLIPEDQVW